MNLVDRGNRSERDFLLATSVRGTPYVQPGNAGAAQGEGPAATRRSSRAFALVQLDDPMREGRLG